MSLFGDEKKLARLAFPQLIQEQGIIAKPQKPELEKHASSDKKSSKQSEFIDLIPLKTSDRERKNKTFVQPGVNQK